ncbi:OprD family outer membrane porin [Sulfuricurvum sp.]|uniref:OprD family outer membrane porin n=1 Tax=Sulfuricurvum sp. TaxID=2025608 RepID=UPI003BAF3497
MKKTVALSLSAVAVLNASSIDEAFIQEKISGEIRTAYISQNNEIESDTYASAVGGIVKYETDTWNGIKLGVGGYISRKLNFATGNFSDEKTNPDFFGEQTRSYAYIGEGYLHYGTEDLEFRIGRQLIDTPFADTDDIRMHPNSFEAAMATYKGIDETTIHGGYITRWAGYDSGNDISKFKKMVPGSNGAAVAGITNESIENLALQGWYYGIDKLSDIFYTDATYTIEFNEKDGLEIIGQLSRFNEKSSSGAEGNVYGIGTNLSIGMLTFGAAYNKASSSAGKQITSGFGNGPYVVDTEEVNLDDFEDVSAYQFNAEADLEDAGIQGVTLNAGYSHFTSTPGNMKVEEIDLIAMYKITEALHAEVNYVIVNDQNNNLGNDGISEYDGGYNRFLVRLNYNF